MNSNLSETERADNSDDTNSELVSNVLFIFTSLFNMSEIITSWANFKHVVKT